MSDVYLREHPNPHQPQYRSPRRQRVRPVIVVHTAENTPDYVAFDGGAEAVAGFVSRRTDAGSYHTLVDSDSAVPLVRYGDEAWHDGTGSNPWSLGLSIATRADVWPLAPKAWRDGAVEQAAQEAARMSRWVHAQTGRHVPAVRITRAQSEAGAAGFITHAERDPARRSDPGAAFPWAQFLARYAELIGTTPTKPPSPQEDDMTPDQIAKLNEAAADAKAARAMVAELYDQIIGRQAEAPTETVRQLVKEAARDAKAAAQQTRRS